MFFLLRPFLEKNHDKIYEKIAQILFLGHFCPFSGIFPKVRISQIWDISSKNNSNMLFPFKPFPDKNNDKIYEQNAKIPFLAIFAHFWAFSPELEFSRKLGPCHF